MCACDVGTPGIESGTAALQTNVKHEYVKPDVFAMFSFHVFGFFIFLHISL